MVKPGDQEIWDRWVGVPVWEFLSGSSDPLRGYVQDYARRAVQEAQQAGAKVINTATLVEVMERVTKHWIDGFEHAAG